MEFIETPQCCICLLMIFIIFKGKILCKAVGSKTFKTLKHNGLRLLYGTSGTGSAFYQQRRRADPIIGSVRRLSCFPMFYAAIFNNGRGIRNLNTATCKPPQPNKPQSHAASGVCHDNNKCLLLFSI